MAISAINLVVLRSNAPRDLVRFYQSLGLNFALEQHGSGPEHHSCAIGNATLEIYPCDNREMTTIGTRIGFAVSSIEVALSGIVGAHKVISKPKQTEWGKRCVLQDPEGHKVELIESLKAA